MYSRKSQVGTNLRSEAWDWGLGTFRAIHWYSNLPSFSRLWIVQEIVLPLPENILRVYGDDVMTAQNLWDWFELMQVCAKHLKGATIPFADREKFIYPRYAAFGINFRFSACDKLKQPKVRVKVEALKQAIGHRNLFPSTDPRDAVYAPLGLAPDSGIVPDYSKTVDGVYTD